MNYPAVGCRLVYLAHLESAAERTINLEISVKHGMVVDLIVVFQLIMDIY